MNLDEKRQLDKWLKEAREAYILVHYMELIIEQELENQTKAA